MRAVVARASNSVPPGTILCKKKLHKVQASAADFSEAEALRIALSDPIWMSVMVARGLPLMLNQVGTDLDVPPVGTEVKCARRNRSKGTSMLPLATTDIPSWSESLREAW